MSFDLSLSDDQRAVEELFATFLSDRCSPGVVRAAEPLGFDRTLWNGFAALGAPGMAVPAELGGGGASLAEVVVAAEQVGRAAAPVPYAEHTVAARVVPDADVVAGDAVATLALRPASADGTWTLVPAGAVADVVVGLDGDELVAVRADAPGAGPLNLASSPTRRPCCPSRRPHGHRRSWRLRSGARRVGGAHRRRSLSASPRRRWTWRSTTSRSATSSVGRSARSRPCSTASPICPASSTAPVCWCTRLRGPGRRRRQRRASTSTATRSPTSPCWRRWRSCSLPTSPRIATDRSLHYHGGYGFSEEYDIQLYLPPGDGAGRCVLGDPGHRGAAARRPAVRRRPVKAADGMDFALPPDVDAYRDEIRRVIAAGGDSRGTRTPAPHRHVQQPRAQPGARRARLHRTRGAGPR